MSAILLAAVATACFAHPTAIDVEVGRRALPWLPPDLARQVVKHERDFARGATLAATWPAPHHQPGPSGALATTMQAQSSRLAAAVRAHAPFAEVVAGLGALAHLIVDANQPFTAGDRSSPYGVAFAGFIRSAAPRIPSVFYGQDFALIQAPANRLGAIVQARRGEADTLASLVHEDLDRVGGPAAWPRLDDRSSSFGAASLTLNHAASDYANLASWIWRVAGGLVPHIVTADASILIWKGDLQPREAPRTHLGFRQTRP